jgi:hypothetical protein
MARNATHRVDDGKRASARFLLAAIPMQGGWAFFAMQARQACQPTHHVDIVPVNLAT